jgi:hypothetical protein
MEEIKVNLDNLTNEERETLLKLVEKGNKTNKKRWRSKRNNKYYSISNCGDLISNIEYGCGLDESSYQLGNYFKTEKEAEFARDKQLIYQKLKDYALEHNTEEIDWNNLNQFKWFIRYDSNYKEIKYCWTRFSIYINQIYFTSKEIVKDAIKEIGEDNIKKYLFGGNE